jgi:hypothetical protein
MHLFPHAFVIAEAQIPTQFNVFMINRSPKNGESKCHVTLQWPPR